MTTDTSTEITEGDWKTLATTEITHLTDEEKDYLPRAWDEWIARVKRDAAREAEAERDEWRQTALDERGAALDALEQVKARDKRIQAVQHLVDQADHAGDWTVTCSRLQWAIDGTNPTIERQETR